jgi:formate--tetrahydrofolate ligase
MISDLDIARRARLRPITSVAADQGLREDELEIYGRYKAKISLEVLDRFRDQPKGKYIVVTAMTPTPLGEGKTVVTIGLAQGLQAIGKRAVSTTRQPSLGPVFGIKGGAAGGGYAQVVPMEDLNLHFTGDFHAITTAHNLLSAMIDSHIHHGNDLQIDPGSVTWPRVLDVLDRSLRQIVTGLGGPQNGIVREASFEITAASEIMAILALTTGLLDLLSRLGRIVIGYTFSGTPVTAEMLQAAGAMAVLLKEAIKPNLIQTLEGGPAFIHTGPFGNIAHGCSSVLADEMALKMNEYVVTECGFGADLGFEKLCHIKCRYSDLTPDAAVLVCTVRSLKSHSGRFKIIPGRPLDPNLMSEDLEAIQMGGANLSKQIENVRLFGVPVVVAINRFPTDTDRELAAITEIAKEAGALEVVVCEVWEHGGEGGKALAEAVIRAADITGPLTYLYPEKAPIEEKIQTIAEKMYGAKQVHFESAAKKHIKRFRKLGFDTLPVCMAKTQYSLSHDPSRKGRPTGYTLPILDVRLSAGAGFLYAICGDIMTMPGLPSQPGATRIDLDEEGQVVGLS